MEDLSILVRDYGLKPQGKSAPMSSTKVSPGVGSSRGAYGSDRKGSLSGRVSGNASTFGGQEDGPYIIRKNGSSKMSGRSTYGGDDLFSPGNYDDVFGGPPKSSAAGPRYDDGFGEAPDTRRAPVFDDLLGGLGVNESKGKVSSPRAGSPRPDRSNFAASETSDLEELLPGFSSEPAKSRASGDATASRDGDPFIPPLIDDPFITTSNDSNSSTYIDPMDVFTVPSINMNADVPHASSNASGAFDGFGIFDGYTNESSVDASKPREASQSSRDDLRKSVEDFTSNHSTGIREPSPTDESEPSERDPPTTVEPMEAYNISSKSSPYFKYGFKSDDGIETSAPSVSTSKHSDDGLFSSSLDSPVPFKARPRSSPFGDVKEKWLTVNEVKLVTKPSSAPPPSRPPPVPSSGKYGSRSRVDHMESSGQEDRFTSSSWPSANVASAAFGNSSEEEQTGGGTPGGSRKDFIGRMDYRTNMANHSGDEKDVEDDAAAAKAREKERQEKERQEKERQEKERQDRESKEAEAREERARRYKEKEREREKDRAAVQRVTLEARERAAQDARDRAQRTAVERATAEARERAALLAQERAARERANVEKANADARERAEHRAALEKAAKDRADQRAAVERAAAEAREKADRIAVERTQAEVRERAERAAAERAAELRQRAAERAAQEARQKAALERERERERAEKEARDRKEQENRRSEHDLDAFFNPGLHTNPSSSEPKRSSSMNNMNNMNSDPNGVRRPTNSNNSRPSSVPSGDYLVSLLEDPVPQQTSNSVEDPSWNKRSGASDRSRERAKQALETIRKREAEMQREQAEKHRAADQLDAEIKRWAAGKEGNLRALLSTLQYVLWPECGWQPVSLSDLITAGSVKKTYRKATLFVHPDKVQQKGATVQQKYIAEKVFDLLKEAWNKFNSEEIF